DHPRPGAGRRDRGRGLVADRRAGDETPPSHRGAVDSAPRPARGIARASVSPNIVALGQLLYSRYLLAFELAGLILLVAMIGAIVLTHRRRADPRTPKAWRQHARRPDES